MNVQLCVQMLQQVAIGLNAINQAIAARTSVVNSVGPFSSLPASPVQGMLAAVTDSTTNTWGATITGGGSNHVLAYFDGAAWTVAGK